jgi:peptidoglycan/xylan/chitin deacetylase (PgdA/CDA1 family)
MTLRQLVYPFIFYFVLTFAGCASASKATNVSVLLYHRFTPDLAKGDLEWTSLAKFREQMEYLKSEGYTTITTSELVDFMRGQKRLPLKSIALTIDDGWRSQKLILPMLKESSFKASFWVFPERGIEDPYDNYLTWNDLINLNAEKDFEIQSHSMTHPYSPTDNLRAWIEGKISGRGYKDVEHELLDSKHMLEAKLKRPINYFAWPAGYYNEKLVELAKEFGYEALMTIDPGTNMPGDDVFRIKRLFVDGACPIDKFAWMLRTNTQVVCGDRR